jgi:phosphoribosyl-ATP pyrophosphohydrolase
MITDEMVEAALAIASPGRNVVEGDDATWQSEVPTMATMRAALTVVLPIIRVGMDDRHGFGELVSSAYAEADKAMQKFPRPNYVISKVAEEAGEVVKAAIHCAEKRETAENVAGEMKQLIAMLYRLWVEGDQVHGLSPIGEAIRAMKGGEG